MPETTIKLRPEFLLEKVAERKISKFLFKVSMSGIPFHFFYCGDFQPSYFTPQMQIAHTIKVSNGQFENVNGLLDGKYIYVTTKDNRIIAKRWDSLTVLNHSFLAMGKSVKAAGFMEFEKGILKTIDNNSGHYKPSARQMLEFLRALEEMVKDPIIFKDYSNKGVIKSCALEDLVMNEGDMEAVQKTEEKAMTGKKANKIGLFNRYIGVLKRHELLEQELEFQIQRKSRAMLGLLNPHAPLKISANASGYINTSDEEMFNEI